MTQCLLAGVLLVIATIASAYVGVTEPRPSQEQLEAFPSSQSQRAVLDRYCVSCHNAKLRTAGLMLDSMDVSHVGAQAEIWEKVIKKLRMGTMPPQGRPRPDRATASALAEWLEMKIDAAADLDPGRTETFHRLNRSEYKNAIRDLLAVEIDVDALLPADDADAHGFDNIAGVLSVSPALFERYMSAARKVARLAVGSPIAGPSIETYKVRDLSFQDDRMNEDLPFGSRGGLAIRHHFPADGEYVLKIRLQRNYVDCIRGLGEPHQIGVHLDGVELADFAIGGEAKGRPAPASFCGNIFGDSAWERYVHEADAGLEVRFVANAGRRLVGVSFRREMWEPEGVLQPSQTVSAQVFDEMPDGHAGVGSVTIAGPYQAASVGETPSRRRVFGCRPKTQSDEALCAKNIVSVLARRAFRRPVTDDDIQALIGFYEAGRREATFEEGIQSVLERLLVDPEFLFRIERDPARMASGSAYRLSGLELASRLSFFLWSSIPDDELLDVASRGSLSDQAVLERQVRRMLRDGRSKALVDNFAGQWLLLRNVRTVFPDPDMFAEFDENLRDAFQQETELFIDSQLRDDRSVVELLSADYTFVNERLARHYQIPHIYGNRFRRVTVNNRQRGGVLGHGGLLTVTSYPNRTSPVLRGKWVLEALLGAPPPPPPADVPALPDRAQSGKAASVRDRLEEHRRNPVCGSCHAQMDPLGFALENFDAIGRWRTVTEVRSPVDASGTLSDGTRFEGPAGLRTVLVDARQEFVRTLTEKLLAYAVGRGMRHGDLPIVRRIERAAAPDDYRWSSIILGIVKSAPFQMRRSGS